MSFTGNQRRILIEFLGALRPYWRSDRNLPGRVQRLLAERRCGSRDRRLYRELVYTALRILPWVEEAEEDEAVGLIATMAADTPATHGFREAFARPDLLEKKAREELLPGWLREECPAAFAPRELTALLARAPLWVRLQTDDEAAVAREFEAAGWAFTRCKILPSAWRMAPDVDVTKSIAYGRGQIEVQDLGSQLILEIVGGGRLGERWLDACAGAGGKTLQLARQLGPSGQVTAHDIREEALAELATRAARAGLRNVTTMTRAPAGLFDGVLVDAPCTGTGTWRRAPHLKWTTQPDDVVRAAGLQQELLRRYAARVRPGGRLVYATCSLCRSENEAVVEAFLAENPAFAAIPLARTFGFVPSARGVAILPATHDTDGFFMAALRRSEG